MSKEKDKPGTEPVSNEKKGFKYWFTNVFWFHYGKWTIAGIAAIAVIVFISIESFSTKIKYDFQMAICLDGEIAYSETEQLLKTVEDAVGDLNGDGKIEIDIQIVDLADEEYAETNQYKLMLLMSQPEYTIFIMDDKYSSLYCAKDYFDDLSSYGIAPDNEYPDRVNITDTGAMKSTGRPYSFYASLCDWTTVGKSSQEVTQAAVRVIKAILAS